MNVVFISVPNSVTSIHLPFYCKYNGVHVFFNEWIKNGGILFSGKSSKIVRDELGKLLRLLFLLLTPAPDGKKG